MPTLTADLIAAALPREARPASVPPGLPPDALAEGLAAVLRARPHPSGVWVFAYGALMWRRGEYAVGQVVPARLPAHARRHALADLSDRGTPEAPGLTLGLEPDAGAACEGLLLHAPEDALGPALSAIWTQEMRPGFYRAAWVAPEPTVGDRRPIPALTFLCDPDSPLNVGAPATAEETAEVLARAVGLNGPAADYLRRTCAALREHDLRDEGLFALEPLVAARLEGRTAVSAGAPPRPPA